MILTHLLRRLGRVGRKEPRVSQDVYMTQTHQGMRGPVERHKEDGTNLIIPKT
jgi:hypothetical protein